MHDVQHIVLLRQGGHQTREGIPVRGMSMLYDSDVSGKTRKVFQTCRQKQKTMTEEQRQLLIKDLCGRLPYGVNVLYVKEDIIGVLGSINSCLGNNDEGKQELKCTTSFYGENNVPIEEFKPYLYPLSSMTEEQYCEYVEYTTKDLKNLMVLLEKKENGTLDSFQVDYNEIDWLNAHHFDYRGLIEQGLAIDATGIIEYRKQEE